MLFYVRVPSLITPVHCITKTEEPKDFDTNLYVGYVPGFPGANSQGETLDKLQTNLCEVIEMLLEDEQTKFKTVFVGTQ